MNNENTILDNGMQNDAPSANDNVSNDGKKNDTAEKFAYAAGGAVVGAGAAFAGQAVAAPKGEKPMNEKETEKEAKTEETKETKPEETKEVKPEETEVKPEEAKETKPEENKETKPEEDKVTEPDNNDHPEDNNHSEHDHTDEIVIEVNGTKVYVDGDAEVNIQDGMIVVSTEEVAPALDYSSDTEDSSDDANAIPPIDDEEDIITTDEYAKVAYVDDSLSFENAFAQARAQVGPGGVFVWHGRAYGTYYANEWNSMTQAERNAYQASVNYDEIMHSHANPHHNYSDVTVDTPNKNNIHQDTPIEPQNDIDSDIQVIHAGETDLNRDGQSEYSVTVVIDDQKVVLVDTDGDYVADVALLNSETEGLEVVNVENEQIELPTVEELNTYYNQDCTDGSCDSTDQGIDYMDDTDASMLTN